MKTESCDETRKLKDGTLPEKDQKTVAQAQKSVRWDSLLTGLQQEKRARTAKRQTIDEMLPQDRALFDMFSKQLGNLRTPDVPREDNENFMGHKGTQTTTSAQVNPSLRGFAGLFLPSASSEELSKKRSLKSFVWGSSSPKFNKT
jgi:hypothetical protein